MGSGASANRPATAAAPTNGGGGGGGGGGEQNEDNRPQTAAPPQPAKSPMQRQMERYGYPPPAPPTKKKAEVFDVREYRKLDKASSKVPDDVLYGTFEEISAHLTKDLINDIQRIRALFTWTTSIDIGSLQSTLEKLPEGGTPLDYLLKIHWQMGNHAHFFAQLCRAAGLPCIIVTGCNKSAAYQLGGKINKKAMAAQWNCIYVDGEWRFIDVFWASTCVVGKKTGEWSLMDVDGEMVDEDEEEGAGETKHQVNEAYFLPDGEAFISTHFPDDPDWQLLEEPIDIDFFEKRVYIRERFFDVGLGLVPKSEYYCVVKPNKGELDFEFGLSTEVDKRKLQFRYLIFRSKQPGEKPPSVPFERFVLFQKKVNAISYSCRFPMTGRYKFDVFGQEDGEHDTFDLCCSYLIDCDVAKKNCQPYPDVPDIGWGPGADMNEVGMEPESHPDPVIYSKDGDVEIRFKCANSMQVMQNMKSNDLDEWLLAKNACMRAEGDELIVNVRLPQKGEYALNLFAEKEGFKGELPNVVNYLVNVEKDNPKLETFPKLHEGLLGKGYLADHLGVKATSHPEGMIDTETGKFTTDFEHKDGIEIICELDNNHYDKKQLSNGINVTSEGGKSSVDVKLPSAGEYSMNVYARVKGDESRVYHVHTYIINSTQTDKQNATASKSEVPTIPYATSGDVAVLRLPLRENEVVGELQRKNAQDPPQKSQIKGMKTEDEDVLAVKLPEEGEYKMDIFEKKANGAVECICTYQLIRHEPLAEEQQQQAAASQASAQKQQKPATPEEQLSKEEKENRRKQASLDAQYKAQREALKAAMASQDPGLIRQAIASFEKNNVPDDKGQLQKAKKLLRFLQISNELTDSMSTRNLERLEKSINAAEKEGFEKKLGLQLKMAKKVLEQLRRIEKLRHAILDLDQKTIAEIKSYSTPPDGVHQVMAAVFILLGHASKEVGDWPKVVILIGKTGKESLKRKITVDFKVENLKIDVATKARNKLQGYELDHIRDVSAGAGTFYVWIMGMIEECESRFTQGGGDINLVRPKTSRPKTSKKKK